MPPADNTRFLLAATQRRSADARKRAEEALGNATKSRKPITVVGIAKAAKVSRSWLYTQSDLIDAITNLQQRQPSPARTGQQSASILSLQNRLDAANHRNKQLRGQIAELAARLETAYGEIRALRNAQPNN
jgi:hypothetical protein